MKDYLSRKIPHIKEIVIKDDYIIFRMIGSVDMLTIPAFPDPPRNNKKMINKHIIIDFCDVDNIDSATLASLVAILFELKEAKRKLAIINATSLLRRYIDILQLGSIVKIYRNEKAAIKDFGLFRE
ncbi:MAG: STAS domain-containing protein [Candidatus Aceula lacicola]|nr:STAS domain-containing protein [Candidatus Aceula lacicola]